MDGYTRVPTATPDEWGELEQQTGAAERELLARLDAEERDAGFGAW